MVVLSVKFTILISWSSICIRLMFLSALLRLASNLDALLHNSIMDSRHPWRTHIGIRQEAVYFNFRFDIGTYNLEHVDEFVSISELMQGRKDKINSKDITERVLFSLFDTSIMTQIVERMCRVTFLIASDQCSTIIVTRPNVFLHLIPKT